MAHTKSGGVTKGNRNAIAKRLGVKKFGGEHVDSGNILIRQRGTAFHPGLGVKLGKDYTLYAVAKGIVHFKKHRGDTIISIQ